MGTFSVLFPIQKTPLLGFAVLVAILIRLGKSVTGQDKSNDKTDECETKYVHFDLEVAKLTLDLCYSVTVTVKTNVSSVIIFGLFNNSVMRRNFLRFSDQAFDKNIKTNFEECHHISYENLSVHANHMHLNKFKSISINHF